MKKKKKISPFLLLRLMGVVLFVVILSRVDLSAVGQALKQTIPGLFLLGVFFQLLVLAIKGVRWHLMNDGRKEKKYWVRSLGTFFESYAIGVVTPGRLGELLKAGHEETKDDKASAFFRVISERGFDVGFFVLFAVLALITGQYIQLSVVWIVLLVVMAIGLLVFAWLLLGSNKFLGILQHFINRFPGRFSTLELKNKKHQQTSVGFIFFLSLLSSTSYFVSCYFLALSVGLEMNFLQVSGGVAIAGLINMLPVTIMGIGTREATFLALFVGNSSSMIIAFSFSMLIVAQLGGGLVSFIVAYLLLQKKS